jgi:hypothetical protein
MTEDVPVKRIGGLSPKGANATDGALQFIIHCEAILFTKPAFDSRNIMDYPAATPWIIFSMSFLVAMTGALSRDLYSHTPSYSPLAVPPDILWVFG